MNLKKNCKHSRKKCEKIKKCNLIHENPLRLVRRTRWKTHRHQKKLIPSTFHKNAALLVCRGASCRCLLGWNTCLTKRHLKESEVCTDKNQRCSDSLQLQIRGSQHKCSTLCTVIIEIGRDELGRTFVNENQRLRHTMNFHGCAAMQCTSRVPSHNLCGLHACTCLAFGTLASFLLPMAGFLLSKIGDNLLDSCGECAGNVG